LDHLFLQFYGEREAEKSMASINPNKLNIYMQKIYHI